MATTKQWTVRELLAIVQGAMAAAKGPVPRCGDCRFYMPERELCVRKHHVQCALDPWEQGCNGRWFKPKEHEAKESK